MKRFFLSNLALTLLILLVFSCTTAEGIRKNFKLKGVIQLDSGKISGVMNEKTKIVSYKGIPYAKPPVGDLRWKPPQSVDSWDGVKVANSFGNSAVQPPQNPFMMWSTEFIISNKNYSEDCLNLNVWTDSSSTDGNKAVIVYIHGGGLTSGGSSCEIYWGDEIAKKDVVYVSINYRLGIFGFFVHPDLSAESESNSSGNYGLMDAVAALKWVRANITEFGGDPNNVTIMGQSAGSRMVNALSISPLAKGLFHRAISESSNPLEPIMSIKSLKDQEDIGLSLTKYVGKTSLNELKAMSAEELQEKSSTFTGGGLFRSYPASLTADNYSLPETDIEAYKSGIQNDVPLLTGCVTGDTMIFGGRTPISLNQYIENSKNTFGDMAYEFLTLYPATNDEEADNMARTVSALDRMNIMNLQLAKARALKGSSPTYVYYFSRPMPASEGLPLMGAFHTADVPYFLNYFYNDLSRPWEEVDYTLGEVMSDYLVNFAKKENPNDRGLPLWDIFNVNNLSIIELGENIKTFTGISQDKMDFWIKYLDRYLGF